MSIKAVIFDLDGTLIAFKLDINTCRTEVIQHLTEKGLPRSMFSIKETAFDMLVKVKNYMTSQGIRDKNFAEIEKLVVSTVERFELEAARTTEMFRGIPETLKALKDMNLKLAVCTISGKNATDHSFKRFNLEPFFDAVIPRESVSAVKPHPIHLETALNALKTSPEEAMLVGDSVKDMTCATRLKVLAVGVTTGISSREELTRAGAHYIISSVNDLPELILQINKQTRREL